MHYSYAEAVKSTLTKTLVSSGLWKGPNTLTGCDLSTLTDLSGLANLEILALEDMGVFGSLPASWSDGFGSLWSLSLRGNLGLTGTLPDSWSSGCVRCVDV